MQRKPVSPGSAAVLGARAPNEDGLTLRLCHLETWKKIDIPPHLPWPLRLSQDNQHCGEQGSPYHNECRNSEWRGRGGGHSLLHDLVVLGANPEKMADVPAGCRKQLLFFIFLRLILFLRTVCM